MKYFVLMTLFLVFACSNFPSDPMATTKKATNSIIKVGYTENPPWVIRSANAPKGIEVSLVEDFADGINAKVQWINGSEQVLYEKLEKYEIDILIGGITDKTPWKKKKVGLTRPYITIEKDKHVMAVKAGENRLITTLERFLHSRRERIHQLVYP